MASLFEAIFAVNSKQNLLEDISEDLEEAFEVFSIGSNGERNRIPTTDPQGKSKYSDAASAEMQKIKLEKENPGKKWTVVQVQDNKKQNLQRTAKQQDVGDRANSKKMNEDLSESVDYLQARDFKKKADNLQKGSKEYHQAMEDHHAALSRHHAKLLNMADTLNAHHNSKGHYSDGRAEYMDHQEDEMYHHGAEAMDHADEASKKTLK